MVADTSRNTRRLQRIKANQRARRLPCWLCGQPIDYALPAGHTDAFSYDHAKAWKLHPELREDPDNGRSAHKRCNSSRGLRDPAPGLGDAAGQW
ncbi:MAG: HNH endonuclease [Mycobacteriales bacterium]